MNNNRDNIIQKRNKLNELSKGKYDKYESARKSNESHLKKTNVMKSNQMNNSQRNDTYESVCSPEDIAERTKVAQKHPNGSSGNSPANNARHAKRIVSPEPIENKGEQHDSIRLRPRWTAIMNKT